MYCPSGDQNGFVAPSVPAMSALREASRGRSHSARLPSGPCAENARLRPSGEIAGDPGNAVFSGGVTANFKTGATGRGRKYITAPTAAPTTTARQSAMAPNSRTRNPLKDSLPSELKSELQPGGGDSARIRMTGSPGLKRNCSPRGSSIGRGLAPGKRAGESAGESVPGTAGGRTATVVLAALPAKRNSITAF